MQTHISIERMETTAQYIADAFRISNIKGCKILARIPDWWKLGPTPLLEEAELVLRDM